MAMALPRPAWAALSVFFTVVSPRRPILLKRQDKLIRHANCFVNEVHLKIFWGDDMNNKLVCISIRRSVVAACAVFLTLLLGTAGAAVLVSQPPVDVGTGWYANPNFPQQAADDFSLGGPVSLQSISWWGGYDLVNGGIEDVDDFLVRIYSEISGAGTILEEYPTVAFTRSSTALTDAVGNAVYRYDFDLTTPLALNAGTHYLFVQNVGASDWFWLTGGATNGNWWFRSEEGDDWSAFGGNLAFELNGERVQVPEPASLTLFGIASLSMLLAVRRRERLDA